MVQDEPSAGEAGSQADAAPAAADPVGDADDLDQRVTEVYTLAVRHPGITRSRLIASSIPPAIVDLATEGLSRRGLLRPGTMPESWEAVPPDVALPAFASQLEQRAGQVRAITGDFAKTYWAVRSRGDDGDASIRVLSSLQELHEATTLINAAASHEILAMRDDSPRTAFVFRMDLAVHRERPLSESGRPLRARTTYDAEVLNFPRAGDVLLARAEGGEEYRFISDVPFSVIIADDTAALIDLTSIDSSGSGSLFVQDRRVVLAMITLLETFWRLATPMTIDGQVQLDRRSYIILSLLAAGANDATIAAQSGISQRTVERKVRALMDQLGATTRFQAGVQAARRGWI